MRPDPSAARLGSPERAHDPPRADPPPGEQPRRADRHDVHQPGRTRRHRRRPGAGRSRWARRVRRRSLRHRQLGSPRHPRRTRVKCFTSQRSESRFWAGVSIPTTKAESEGFKRTAAAYARRCGEVSGWLLPHISTADTVRDLDHLRALMGEEKLTYVGLSYGTYLGQTYANMFGDRIRAMMLNGVVDPTKYSKGSEARLAATVRPSDGVYRPVPLALRRRRPGALRARRRPPHGGRALRPAFSAAEARADSGSGGAAAPLGTPEAELRGSADLPVRADQGSQDVADQCRESRRRAQGRRIDARERGRRLQYARRLGPHNAVDGDPVRRRARPPEMRAWPSVIGRFARISRLQGALQGWWQWAPCAAWPVRGEDTYRGPWTASTPNPVLVINNTFDPEHGLCQRRARRAATGQRGPAHTGGLRSH